MAIILITISYLLLGAHSVRGGDFGLATFFVGCLALAMTKERWAGAVTTVVLGTGSLIWLLKGSELINMRISLGADWMRLGAIMGVVFAVTLFSSALPFAPAGRKWFIRDFDKMWFKAAIFLLTAVFLELTRSNAPFPVLLVDRFFPGWGRAEIFLIATYASWIGGKMFMPDGAKKMRPLIWSIFSGAFFLQLALGIAGFDKFLMTGNLHLPVPALIAAGPVFRGSGFFMPILFAVSVLLVGPAWCSHLCYIGAWDDISSRIGGKRPDAKFPHALIWVRLILLVLVVAVAWRLRANGVSGFDAFIWAAIFGAVSLFVMFIFSRRMGMMIHCTAFCPMGIAGNILGKLSPWRMKISSDCNQCGKCSKVCRYGALRKVDIQAGRAGLSCTLCGDCVVPCASGCMGYKLPFLSSELSRKIFLVLVISLHCLFLGVARM